MAEPVADAVRRTLRVVPDFPREGILFQDITPVLADPALLARVVDALAAPHAGEVDVVVGVEARGFILGAPVALRLGVPFVPARKPGKLPRETLSEAYPLEYGEAELHVHADAIPEGARVLVVDDVLATGGTLAAAVRLVERAGGTVRACALILEIAALNGRRRLDVPVHALVAV